jgi:hypothetical protein
VPDELCAAIVAMARVGRRKSGDTKIETAAAATTAT